MAASLPVFVAGSGEQSRWMRPLEQGGMAREGRKSASHYMGAQMAKIN